MEICQPFLVQFLTYGSKCHMAMSKHLRLFVMAAAVDKKALDGHNAFISGQSGTRKACLHSLTKEQHLILWIKPCGLS